MERENLAPAGAVAAPPGVRVCGRHFDTPIVLAGGMISIVSLGIGIGIATEGTNSDPAPWNKISSIIGWWYFMAWAISFLPQLYLNFVRKSVIGQSFDYVFLNVLGYASYSIYTTSFYFVGSVKMEYKERFGNANTVDLNDVCFALWALVLTIINAYQIRIYEGGGQQTSTVAKLAIVLVVAIMLFWSTLIVAGVHKPVFFNALDLLYGLSLVKLAVTIVKYIPQVYLNYRRKLTVGWNIWNVLLDFTGGSLSVLQQLIDCGTTGRWNGIAGNPLKFCLGSFSMIYDIVFIVQHFILYRENNFRVQLEQMSCAN